MFKKQYRLTKNKEFQSVMKGGQAAYSPVLMLKYYKNNLDYSRIGIIVSNKVSKKAVRRNLARRRIREILQSMFTQLKPGYDIVFIASPKIVVDDKVVKYKQIEQFLQSLLKKSKLI